MRERLWGLALLLIGVLWMWDGWRLWQAERAASMFDSLGPDRYLIVLGGLLALTGIVIGLSPAQPSYSGGASAAAEPREPWLFSMPVVFTAVLAVYALLMPVLGYTASTFLYFLAAFFLAGRRNPVSTLVASVISAVIFYLLFPYLADMPLPRGLIGF